MSLVSFNNVEENMRVVPELPYASVGTDAVVDPDGHPHPRLHGTFPRVLGTFRSGARRVLPDRGGPEDDVAGRAVVGWEGRLGEVRPGLPADLVLFDPSRWRTVATFESPAGGARRHRGCLGRRSAGGQGRRARLGRGRRRRMRPGAAQGAALVRHGPQAGGGGGGRRARRAAAGAAAQTQSVRACRASSAWAACRSIPASTPSTTTSSPPTSR